VTVKNQQNTKDGTTGSVVAQWLHDALCYQCKVGTGHSPSL